MTPRTNSPDSAFWRDLEQRFLQGRELRADYAPAIKAEERWLLDGRAADVDDFKALAELAVVALGNPPGSSAWIDWLEILRSNSSDFRNSTTASEVDLHRFHTEMQLGTFDHLRETSARFCRILQSESQKIALLDEATVHHSTDDPDTGPVDVPVPLVTPSRQSTWLKAEMQKRNNMSVYRLHKVGGPAQKTIRGILKGKTVSTDPRVLQKLASGLSHGEGPAVSPKDIPRA